MTLTSLQLFHPSFFCSFSTVRLHVVFGRPTARFPSGCHPNATLQLSVASFLKTCPEEPQQIVKPCETAGASSAGVQPSLPEVRTSSGRVVWKPARFRDYVP